MAGRGSRRRRLAGALGAMAAAVGAGRVRAGEIGTRDVCGWYRAQGPLCRGGARKEQWCERCCDSVNGCRVIRCEWRVVGRY